MLTVLLLPCFDWQELAAAVNNPAVDTAKLMKEADTNRDGVIDRQEYRKVVVGG